MGRKFKVNSYIVLYLQNCFFFVKLSMFRKKLKQRLNTFLCYMTTALVSVERSLSVNRKNCAHNERFII